MISIVIPAYNEEYYLEQTLITLRDVIRDKPVEIIVVDNGSTDNTVEICRKFDFVKLVQLSIRLTVSEARNLGVSHSSYSCLAFIDADILITAEWFDALLHYAENIESNEMLVTGCKVRVSRAPSKIEKFWFCCLKGSSTSYINSGNLICTRKLFDRIGGFSTNLKTGEDVDFCQKARNIGAQIEHNTKFFVYHEGYPKNLKAFFKRERWHGLGDTQSLQKFFSSKVALTSFSIAGLTITAVGLLAFGFYKYAILSIIILLLINFIVLIKRLSIISITQLLYAMLLNYLYLIARFTSIFSNIEKRFR